MLEGAFPQGSLFRVRLAAFATMPTLAAKRVGFEAPARESLGGFDRDLADTLPDDGDHPLPRFHAGWPHPKTGDEAS